LRNRVEVLRLQHGWKTQQELSNRTKLIDPSGKGISQATISDIEKFHITVKGRNLKLLMLVFNCTEQDILIY
jgi:transcriptional regulator with XRE-family HTH domain